MASMECSGVWRILVVSSMFFCASIILTAPGVKALRFLKNPPQFSTAYVGMNVDFNCTTDDPNATVSLLHSSNFVTWIEKLVTPNKLVLRGQVFTLLNLVLLDGGQYACKATDHSGQTIQSSATFVHIIPGGLPNHFELIPDGPIYVLQGKDGTVTCECDGANIASLKWEFKGTSEDAYAAVPSGWVTNIPEPSTNKRKAILKITKAQLAYSGIYKCTVTVNDKSDFKLVNIQVKAPTAPTIKPYKGETVITEESTKVIQCVGEGYPKPKVTWYRNGKMLNTTNCVNNDPKSCENVIYEVYEEGDDLIYTYQTLKIRSAVYPRDIGEFKCVASNGISPDAELSINLDVQVAPKILEQKNLPVAQYDEEFSVSCKLVKGNPLPTFKWQYALHNLDCDFFKSNCFPDVSQWKPVPQQLMITPTATPTNESIVKVESHQQTTFYRCQAFNKLGNDSQLLKFVRLGKNKEAIEINKTKARTEHNVQSTLHVYCIERSGGFLKVLFTKDGKSLLAGNDSRVNVTVEKKNRQESLYTLTVKNLTLNDTGSYGCTSELKYPEILSSINITIKSLAAPNISDIPDQKVRQVEQGGVVTLWCQVTGNPKPSITWYFYKDGKGDGEKVNKENNDLGGNSDNCKTRTKGYYYLSRDDPSRLVICNPEFEQHQGRYQCHVKNKVDVMDKDAYVIVEMVPVIIEPEQGYTPPPLEIGDKLNMTCKAKGNPSPNIMWIKNSTGEIVASSTTNYNQLLITSMKEEDFGVYSCIASNMLKSTEVSVNVIKALAAPNISDMPDQKVRQVEQGGIVMLWCQVTGNPKPSITWYFYKDGKGDREQVNKENNDLGGNSDNCKTRTKGYYYLFRDDPSRLVICNPEFEQHQGKYQCLVKNKVGFMDKDAYVIVEMVPVIIEPEQGYTPPPLEIGDKLNMTCKAKGNPSPNIMWIKNSTGEIVASSTTNYNQLLITSMKEEDFGVYSCIASNMLKSTEVSVNVIKAASTLTNEGGGLSPGALVGIAFGMGVFVLIVLVACCCVHRRQKKQLLYFLQQTDYQIDPDRSLLEQCNDLPYDPDWEFPEERLILGKVLGAGTFGQVVQAEAIGILALNPREKSTESFKRRSKIRRSSRTNDLKKEDSGAGWKNLKVPVVVKTLKEGATQAEYKDLASELKILIHLGQHKNIVNLLGACTRGKRLMVIIEYAPHGSLLSFLRGRRDTYEANWTKTMNDPDKEFTLVDLVIIGFQVARGLSFLASKKCVHRDVAARNILVGYDYVMKIADFGLARDIYKDDLYVKKTQGLLPVKWMAPESLFDRIYNKKTDVWSFGILLWETFTLGGTPYPGLPTEQLLDYLSDGKRMDIPAKCPLEVYTIMRDCWIQDADERPHFTTLTERLAKILEKHTTTDNPYLEMLEEEPEATSQGYYMQPCDDASLRQSKRYVKSPVPSPTSDTDEPPHFGDTNKDGERTRYDSPLPSLPPDLSVMSDDDFPNEPLPPIPTDGEEFPERTNSAGGESGIDMDGVDDEYVEDARADSPILPPPGNKPVAIEVDAVPEAKVLIKGKKHRIETAL